jgi:hypothetical protein
MGFQTCIEFHLVSFANDECALTASHVLTHLSNPCMWVMNNLLVIPCESLARKKHESMAGALKTENGESH